MKRYFSGIALALALVLLLGLTKLGSSPVDAYPNLGSNCAQCHPGQAQPKPPAPTPTKPAPAKPAPTKPAPTKPAPTVTVAVSCNKCHPQVSSPVPGMKCEACHEGAAAHMKAPSRANIGLKSAAVSIGFEIDPAAHLKLSQQGVQTCGNCHKHAFGSGVKSGILVPIKAQTGEYLGWAQVTGGAAYLSGTNIKVREKYQKITWEPGPGGGAAGATIWVASP